MDDILLPLPLVAGSRRQQHHVFCSLLKRLRCARSWRISPAAALKALSLVLCLVSRIMSGLRPLLCSLPRALFIIFQRLETPLEEEPSFHFRPPTLCAHLFYVEHEFEDTTRDSLENLSLKVL